MPTSDQSACGLNSARLTIVALLFAWPLSAWSQTTSCVTYSGAIGTWTVPANTNTVTVEAWGAQGGDSTWGPLIPGGLGAYVKGDISVTPGEVLTVLVGGRGESLAVGGGGGGSFVARADNSPLVVAGGGGGASSDAPGIGAVLTESGTADSTGLIAGGSAGNGGSACAGDASGGGGGGYFTNGADAVGMPNFGRGGIAFLNGGTIVPGGRDDGACSNDPAGGFGGGGSATCNTVGAGGGGGYSGGGGGPHLNQCAAMSRGGGGGGGSFNAGTNQDGLAANRAGNGEVCFTYTPGPAPAPARVPVLGPIGLGLMSLLLGGLGFSASRRKN